MGRANLPIRRSFVVCIYFVYFWAHTLPFSRPVASLNHISSEQELHCWATDLESFFSILEQLRVYTPGGAYRFRPFSRSIGYFSSDLVFFTACFDFAFEHGVCAAVGGVSGVFLGSGGGVLVAAFVLLRREWRNKGLGKESKNRRANRGLYQDWIGIWYT
jgi:hypothetical protein